MIYTILYLLQVVYLGIFTTQVGLVMFRREPADSLGVWLQAMGIVYLEMVCVRN